MNKYLICINELEQESYTHHLPCTIEKEVPEKLKNQTNIGKKGGFYRKPECSIVKAFYATEDKKVRHACKKEEWCSDRAREQEEG